MSEDRIMIEGIGFYGYHGDLPQERDLGQPFRVDVELVLDCAKAGKSDQIENTIDYGAVVRRVVEIGEQEQFHLIEALAERLAAVILTEFTPDEVSIAVTKPHSPIPFTVENVGIKIRRRRP
ncbi:MAG: dihydroneopterin aldolase [bacterium]|nr:dihydroneopterin aldolase [bacterium]